MKIKSSEFIDSDLPTNADLSQEALLSTGRTSANGIINNNGKAELDARVELARQQMLELKRQQDQLERERLELEELRRREESFEQGKTEVINELSRMINLIEQEEFEVHKRASVLTHCRENFQDHHRLLCDIHETEWTSEELKSELNKACLVLDAARAELNKGRAQLSSLGDQAVDFSQNPSHSNGFNPSADSSNFDFALEVKRGFARNLPLILLGIAALLFYYLKHSS